MKTVTFLLLAITFFIVGCASPNLSTIDSDNDGVVDAKDICPNTPALALVDKYGCALDSDKDGVIDLYDKCPNTGILQLVNAEGCPVKYTKK